MMITNNSHGSGDEDPDDSREIIRRTFIFLILGATAALVCYVISYVQP